MEDAGFTVAGVHPARRCTSPFGVVLVGWGDGVGDCHDASRERLFIFPSFLFVGKTMFFFGVWSGIIGHCWIC